MRGRILSLAMTMIILPTQGCTLGPEPIPPEPPTTTSSGPPTKSAPNPSVPTADPPLRFADKPIAVGIGRIAIADGVAYSYTDDGLLATDLSTGSQRWFVPFEDTFKLVTGPMSMNNPPVPGVIADKDGKTLIVTPYQRFLPGTGTQADNMQTQVVAVDADGRIRWEETLPTGFEWVAGELHDNGGAAVVLGGSSTTVLDTATGNVRWAKDGMSHATVDGDQVIGVPATGPGSQLPPVVALRGSDGNQLWASPAPTTSDLISTPPTVRGAGAGRVIVTGDADSYRTSLLDTATGQPVTTMQDNRTCMFDELDTVVCWDLAGGNDLPELLVGVDAKTGKQLWQLPDETTQRTSLRVSTAFHGAIYGHATNTSVILDARTGHDIVGDATIEPTYVVPGYGVVEYGTDDATAYPSTE